jgi:hypothetical protein
MDLSNILELQGLEPPAEEHQIGSIGCDVSSVSIACG